MTHDGEVRAGDEHDERRHEHERAVGLPGHPPILPAASSPRKARLREAGRTRARRRALRMTHSAAMNFHSVYDHGFVRVAACTVPTVIVDPAANAQATLAVARECSDEGVGLAVFPELGLSRLLGRGPAAAGRPARRGRGGAGDASSRRAVTCCRCSSWAPRCERAAGSTTAPSCCTAGGSSASRRSPTCRPTASSTSGARSRPATTSGARSRSPGRSVPFGRTCCSGASDVDGLVIHVEVCEDFWVPIPAVGRGCARRGDGLGQHLGLADHRRQGARAAPCCASRPRRAASRPTCMPLPEKASRRPTCPGTVRRWCGRTAPCWPRASASPTGRAARSRMCTCAGCARSGCARARSTTTAAPTPSGSDASAR